jgi:hypothetical protein
MVNHQAIGLTRINMKVDLDATTISYISYKLNAQLKKNIEQRFKIKDKEHWLNALGLALIR